MTVVERIEYMIKMSSEVPKKDDAKIYIPRGMDAAVEKRTLETVLKVMKGKQ